MSGQGAKDQQASHRAARQMRSRFTYAVAPFVLALGLFLLTLAPTVTAEDSGELVAAAWHFGIPHPPGYPLWTSLCGVFIHVIPFGCVALRANLFSALCGAGAAVMGYAAIRELRVSRPVAASAALIWVWSRWSWSQSVITEVYSLNSLLTAAVVWCGFRWYRTRRTTPLLWASLFMGLGMSNHHIIALAGLAVVTWILVQQPKLLRRGRLALGCISLFVVGLLPYVYLPLRAAADPPINWGDPSTPQRFWEHVSRHQYGTLGPMRTPEPRSLTRFGSQLSYLGESLCDDLTPWLTGAGVAGLFVLARRERRVLLFALLWLACTGVAFALLANYDADRTSRWAMRVFLIPMSLGPVIGIAFLLDWTADVLRRPFGARVWASRTCVAGLIVCGPAIQAVSHWRQCDYSNYWYAHDHAHNLLRCMLPNALVFPSGDHSAFPLVYLVTVERVRPDVLIADIYGYTTPKLYRDRPDDSPDSPTAWLIKHARRPVYYTTKKAPPVEHAHFVRAGMLYHLLPDGKRFDAAGLLDECGYRNPTEPPVLDIGASHILSEYKFFTALHDLEHDRQETALAHFRAAARLADGIKEAFNNIGSALGEYGLSDEAIGYFQQAAALEPHYTLPRWNLFRTFKAKSRWSEARDQLTAILEADADDFRAHGEMGFLLATHFDDRDGAIHSWRESLHGNPNQPQIVDALAEHRQAP